MAKPLNIVKAYIDKNTADVYADAGLSSLRFIASGTNITSGGTGSGLQNVVEDITPQLGGNLDAQSNDILGINELTAITGTFTTGLTVGTGTVHITGNTIAIGVPSPTHDLHIIGSGTFTQGIEIDEGPIRTSGIVQFSDGSILTTAEASRDASGHIDTISFVRTFDVNVAPIRTPRGVFFKPDGTKMFISAIGFAANSFIHEYSLSTPWDISTATETQSLDIPNTGQDLFFSPNGLRLYSITTGSDLVEYSLSKPWDISNPSLESQKNKDFSSDLQVTLGLFIRHDGKKLYLSGVAPSSTDSRMVEYDLSVPWDASTAQLKNTVSPTALENRSDRGIFFRSDGRRLYFAARDLVTGVDMELHEFSLSVPWDLSTASSTRVIPTLAERSLSQNGLYFRSDTNKFYIADELNRNIDEYDFGVGIGTNRGNLIIDEGDITVNSGTLLVNSGTFTQSLEVRELTVTGTSPGITAVTGTFTSKPDVSGDSVALKSETDALQAQIDIVSINVQTGTDYTLVSNDLGKMITLDNGSAITFTVPANSSVAFDIGSTVALAQVGSGIVTVTGAGGVTVNSRGGLVNTSGQYATASLLKLATDEWLLAGDLF